MTSDCFHGKFCHQALKNVSAALTSLNTTKIQGYAQVLFQIAINNYKDKSGSSVNSDLKL